MRALIDSSAPQQNFVLGCEGLLSSPHTAQGPTSAGMSSAQPEAEKTVTTANQVGRIVYEQDIYHPAFSWTVCVIEKHYELGVACIPRATHRLCHFIIRLTENGGGQTETRFQKL